jgi:hypothetical protein
MTTTLAEIADAVREQDEPPLCPCGSGYVGHADDDLLGHRCEYDPRAPKTRLSFRGSAEQWYRDDWRRVQRLCEYTGDCVVCDRRCYEFRDGENDPRGPLGDHSDSGLSPEDYEDIRTGKPFSSELPEVPACFSCMNEEGPYRSAVRTAERRWRFASESELPDETPMGEAYGG